MRPEPLRWKLWEVILKAVFGRAGELSRRSLLPPLRSRSETRWRSTTRGVKGRDGSASEARASEMTL